MSPTEASVPITDKFVGPDIQDGSIQLKRLSSIELNSSQPVTGEVVYFLTFLLSHCFFNYKSVNLFHWNFSTFSLQSQRTFLCMQNVP